MRDYDLILDPFDDIYFTVDDADLWVCFLSGEEEWKDYGILFTSELHRDHLELVRRLNKELWIKV